MCVGLIVVFFYLHRGGICFVDIDLSIFVSTVQQKPRLPSPGCCFTPLQTIVQTSFISAL